MKRVMAIAMTLAMLLCCVTAMAWAESEYPYGDGTKDNPYQFEVVKEYDDDSDFTGYGLEFKGNSEDYNAEIMNLDKVYATFEVPEDDGLLDLYIVFGNLYEDVTVYKNGDEGTPCTFIEDWNEWNLKECPVSRGDRIDICATVKPMGEDDYAEFRMYLLLEDDFGIGTKESPYILEGTFDDDDYEWFQRPEDSSSVEIAGKDEIWYVLNPSRKTHLNVSAGYSYSNDEFAFSSGELYVGTTENAVGELFREKDEYDNEYQYRFPEIIADEGEAVYIRLDVNKNYDPETSEYGFYVDGYGREFEGIGTLEEPFKLSYDYDEEYSRGPLNGPSEPGDYYYMMNVAMDDWLVFNANAYGSRAIGSVEFCDADGNAIGSFVDRSDDYCAYYFGDIKATAEQKIYIRVHLTEKVSEDDWWFGVSPNEVYGYLASEKDTYTYTGKAIKPAVLADDLRYADDLVKGRDYTVTYSNNIKAGEGKATITPIGDYAGMKKTYVFFRIVPKKAYIKSLSVGSKRLTVKASTKVSSTGGTVYQIAYKQKGTSKWKYTTTTSQSKTIKSLKKGKRYYIKVRAYRTYMCTKYYGSWSTTKLSKKIK